MKALTNDSVPEYEPFIEYCVDRYGRHMDREECTAEAWSVLLQARKTYSRFAGCCSFEAYVEIRMEQRMDQLRTERNERIAVESPVSLDMMYYDTNESMRDHIPRKTNDCSAGVALWDYARRLGPEKYAVLRMISQTYTKEEIMEARHISQEWYRILMEDIENDFREWLAI